MDHSADSATDARGLYGARLDFIRKRAFESSEVHCPGQQHEEYNGRTGCDAAELWIVYSQNRPTKSINHASHGIQAVEQPPLLRDKLRLVGNWGSKHPDLNKERDHVAHVSITDIQGRQP